MTEFEDDWQTVDRVLAGAVESIEEAQQTAARSRKDVPVKLIGELATAVTRAKLAHETAVDLFRAVQETSLAIGRRNIELAGRLDNLERRFRHETGIVP